MYHLSEPANLERDGGHYITCELHVCSTHMYKCVHVHVHTCLLEYMYVKFMYVQYTVFRDVICIPIVIHVPIVLRTTGEGRLFKVCKLLCNLLYFETCT